MAYVFVLNGRERCRAFQLTKDEHTFGQRDDADFVLKDPWISWSHAKIVKEGPGFAIEDLGSTNGTYVDCVKVKRRPLADDDVIFLGRTHLLFVASNRPPSAPPPPAPRDPARERWSGTDRLAVQADDIDVRPIFSDEREGAPSTLEFRGPLEDFGRIEELEEVGREPDTDGFLPPPPREPAAPRDSSAVEIDVADLLDSDGQIVAAAPAEEGGGDWAISSAAESPAASIANPAAEIERLRALVAARDQEVRRLREELQKLKEQYLDL